MDTSGSGMKWQKVSAMDRLSWGVIDHSSTPAPDQHVEFCVDCAQARWLSYEVAEIQKPG